MVKAPITMRYGSRVACGVVIGAAATLGLGGCSKVARNYRFLPPDMTQEMFRDPAEVEAERKQAERERARRVYSKRAPIPREAREYSGPIKLLGGWNRDGERISLPPDTWVFNTRRFRIALDHLSVSDYAGVADSELYYSYDHGATWTPAYGRLHLWRDARGTDRLAFTVEAQGDGLIGLYDVQPRGANVVRRQEGPTARYGNEFPPEPGTLPKRYVYVDTKPPEAREVRAERIEMDVLRVAWAFDEDIPPVDGRAVTILFDGNVKEEGLGISGEIDMLAFPYELTLTIICVDHAGNRSKAVHVSLPAWKEKGKTSSPGR